VNLPIVGKVRFTEVSKEALLDFWNDIVRSAGLRIEFGERMEKVEQHGEGFVVQGSRRQYRARSVLLAVGRRGSPRRLGVTGEDLPKVAYRLVDAAQYEGCKALVVGGGDSALEAALDLSRQKGTDVTLAYRGAAFNRVKPANREKLEAAERARRLRVLMSCEVNQIGEREVLLLKEGNPVTLPNDFVLVAAGGVLPTEMLKSIGVRVATKHGTA
jgi:thioredoxin reductase